MTTWTRNIVWAILLSFSSMSYSAPLKPGDPPPALRLDKLIQAPAGTDASWEKLRGRVVVLEFWATWCGPCVKAIPHLNELAEQFKEKPVQFIAVTAENVQIVEQFLKRKPINAWIGIDEFHELNTAYDITGIPVTVVVNQQGIIADVTHPVLLTAEKLNRILAGEIMPVRQNEPGSSSAEAGLEKVDPEKSLFEVSIRPSKPPKKGGGTGMWQDARDKGEITGSIATVEGALHAVYDASPARMVIKTELPKGNFDFTVCVPGADSKRVEQLFGEALFSTFKLRVKRVVEEVPVYVLSHGTNQLGRGLKPASGPGGGGSGNQGINSGGTTMGSVAGMLESVLHRPVVDETKMEGFYEVHLGWKLSERMMAPYQLSAGVVGAVLDGKADQTALTDEEKSIVRAIKGELSPEALKALPEKTQRLCQIIREELSKPESEQFLPEPADVAQAVREKLGLELTSGKRKVELLVVERGSK